MKLSTLGIDLGKTFHLVGMNQCASPAPAVGKSTDFTRRKFLAAAGASALSFWTISCARSSIKPGSVSTTTDLNLMRGCNTDFVGDYQAAGITVSGVRHYCAHNTVPSVWPTRPTGPNTTVFMCVSIYPNVSTLLSGGYDSQLTSFLQGAQPKDMLNCWHEASSMSYTDGTGHLLTSTDQCKMLTYLQKFAKAQGSPVVVGAIEVPQWGTSSAWMPSQLDFYGLDIYQNQESDPVSTLNVWWDQVVTNGYGSSVATIAVCECNCDNAASRPCYFYDVANWLRSQTRGGPSCFLTYWNPNGPMSGPWLSTDTATINELKNIGNGNYNNPGGC